MRRLIPIALALLTLGIAPAIASAHTAAPPHLSCGELDGQFHNFPAGPQQVTLNYSVDGIVQPSVTLTGNGPDFDVSTGYYNADAGDHVVSAQWVWTADGGGKSSIVNTTIGRCEPPAFQRDIVNIQTQVTNLSILITNITNRIDTISCTSNRIYRFLIRTSIDGSPVVAVESGLVRNQAEFWSMDVVQRGGANRFRVTADYRGLTIPKGQVRTAVTFVRTADGRRWRTVQRLRLCMDGSDGNLNDTGSQGREGI